MQFMKRVEYILQIENITYNKAVVAEVIQKHFPDWRRVIHELQRYSATGAIDSGILANLQETSIRELIDFMKDKNYTEMRKWVKYNLDTDVNILYNQFYDTCSDFLEKTSVPQIILLIAEYQYKNAFAANPEINFMAFLTEVMIRCEFE
jgi:DNA polymerase III delta prime subunit